MAVGWGSAVAARRGVVSPQLVKNSDGCLEFFADWCVFICWVVCFNQFAFVCGVFECVLACSGFVCI